MCCATKRLVEIQCPEDCRYLDAANRHPAAVVKRQIDQDLSVLMSSVGRLSEQQLQLLFLVQSMVLSFKPEGLARLTDRDLALAHRGDRQLARNRQQRVDFRGGDRLGSR